MGSAVTWVETAADEPTVDDPSTAQGSLSVGAVEVREVRRALGELSRRVRAHGHGTSTPRTEWADLVAGCQALVNTATAIQDVAITRVAAVEEEWLEDGTFVEVPRAPGHVALDAPDVVAGSLCVSHVHAQRRVSLAVRVAADGDHAAGTDSGLGSLHAAMLDGRLDGYRAGVVAEELAEAPREVAAAVVKALEEHLGSESAAQLRRRSRRVLARISPDLLRQRARRAREACGLRRWADEPGVDHWEGTFPSEDAALGWAAVDALARRYVKEGVCDRLEAARGRALIDLVTGQATIEVTVVVTVPRRPIRWMPTARRPSGDRSQAMASSHRMTQRLRIPRLTSRPRLTLRPRLALRPGMTPRPRLTPRPTLTRVHPTGLPVPCRQPSAGARQRPRRRGHPRLTWTTSSR